MEISLCMIVKNEEETLGRCLNSIKGCVDEIIIVDTGSQDKTKEIANSFNAKIFDFTWCDDFAKARNYSFSLATKEFIMWLDADDFLNEYNAKKLLGLKNALKSDIDIINMDYSLSRDEKGKTITSLKRNRIIRRNESTKWIGKVHEYLSVEGKVLYSDIEIFHGKNREYTDRNLKIFEKMKADGENFTTRDLYYFANELFDNGYFEKAAQQYEEVINLNGWIEDRIISVVNLSYCYRISGENEKAIQSLLKSFIWCKPRAIVCCKLGELFLENNSYEDSIFWYKIALESTPDKDSVGLTNIDYYTWIPAIQICVCYEKLGEYDSAYYYNELSEILGAPEKKTSYNRELIKEKAYLQNIKIPNLLVRLKDCRY